MSDERAARPVLQTICSTNLSDTTRDWAFGPSPHGKEDL
jgi:hypothetical protein